MKKITVSFLSAVILCGYSLFATPSDDGQNTRSYPVRGVVERIAPDLHQVTIHHQTIPGYMMEMTMGFSVKDTNELAGISVKDEVAFTLVVNENESWIQNIKRIGHSSEITTNAMPQKMQMPGMTELKTGDAMPDYMLTTESGKPIHFSDFRGKAVAFTFFFTRCPLPDFCPRMNNNFEQTRKILLSSADTSTNWQFLSISFDAEFDSPEVLGNYAKSYRGNDSDRWLFAAVSADTLAKLAPRLDLMVMRTGLSFTHNLRTVVLDPQGHIFRQLDGNLWTPQELADAIKAAAKIPAP